METPLLKPWKCLAGSFRWILRTVIQKNNCLMNFCLLSTSNWTVTGSSSKISHFLPNQWERRKKWYWRFIKSSFFTPSIDSGGWSSALWLHKSMLQLLYIYNCILSSYYWYLCVILMGNSCLVYFVLNGLTGVRTTSWSWLLERCTGVSCFTFCLAFFKRSVLKGSYFSNSFLPFFLKLFLSFFYLCSLWADSSLLTSCSLLIRLLICHQNYFCWGNISLV